MTAATAPSLRHVPLSLFAMVMGIAGLALATRRAAPLLGLPDWPALSLTGVAAALFVVLVALQLVRAARYPGALAAEFDHPVKRAFAPAATVALLLLSAALHPVAPTLAAGLALIAAPAHLWLTLAVLRRWAQSDGFEPAHMSPAWFIPIVGNVVAPLALVPLGWTEAAWFFFSTGLLFWLALFSIVLNRIIFHAPLPERLAPTLAILIAPPAVAFLSWVALTGAIDPLARILFHSALFMTLLLVTMAPALLRPRFHVSWWAWSFPLAAMASAAWTMADRVGGGFFEALAAALGALAILVVAGLAWRTALGALRCEIGAPD